MTRPGVMIAWATTLSVAIVTVLLVVWLLLEYAGGAR